MPSKKSTTQLSHAPPHHRKRPIIQVEGLMKSFLLGKERYYALQDITLDIFMDDFTIIYGPSGAGKSTFLNIIIGLEQPTKGNVIVAGKQMTMMSDQDRTHFRKEKFGVVYQQPAWIKSLSVIENVALPLIIDGQKESFALKQAYKSLEEIGVAQFANHKPNAISVGQQQRVSLARALILHPPILILDEPTGNLDTHAADQVLELLQRLNQSERRTIIMVTHNLIYLPYANRRVVFKDGLVNKIELKPSTMAALMQKELG